MQNSKIQLKTHKLKNTYTQPHFFVLNKGNNSGKPMEKACPNCFVCLSKTEDEKQKLYWLFYGLWQGRFFHPFLTGSVIPFIRINDVKNTATIALQKIELQPILFDKNLNAVQALDKHSKVILEQIQLIKQAKKALMYQVLK